MFRTIITLKKESGEDVVKALRQECIKAHDNRGGKVEIKDISDRCFIFEGTEKDFSCLQLAYLDLDENETFLSNVETWEWKDEDPDEDCDLLTELLRPVRTTL